MLNRFRNFISRHKLFDTQDRILLAVSGGLDSMVMLDLFKEAKLNFGVAHCNFQLRGDASDEEEVLVNQSCHRYGVECYSKRFETNNYAEKSGQSIQMAARELRYDWFNEILSQSSFHWLATAHHLNDNLETVLLRWTQGTSLERMTGIPILNGKIIRPLLFASRAEIETYARSKKLTWREDASNASDDYHRNFIRHQVIPKLREINPSLEETFADSLEKIRGSYELMLRGLEQLKDTITKTSGRDFIIDKNLLGLMKNPAFICYEWLKPYGFEWDRCVQLAEALESQPGKQFLSGTHRAVIDRETIIVSPVMEWPNDILIEEGQDRAGLGIWQLSIRESDGTAIRKEREFASLDKSKVKFPLLWRKWRNGDDFYPLGMGHRKKVSDFLIDEKVPVSDKSQVTVVESAGEVIWVAAYRIDDRYKVTPGTKKVLELQISLI